MIDIDKLRQDLIDYFGTAMNIVSPLAIISLEKVETANEEEIIKIALENNFNLNEYLRNKRNIH